MMLETVKLVEDDKMVRASLRSQVEFAELTAIEEVGPRLGTLEAYLSRPFDADAGISDFQLVPSGYANFNGAELVAAWYRKSIPALLCTRFEHSQIDVIRPHRRNIPVLMAPDELTPESLLAGLRMCMDEFEGKFVAARKPWRAQVHFVAVDPDDARAYLVELPAWGRELIVKVRINDLPSALRARLAPGFRCFAQSNIGAEMSDDLYISDWEGTE
jgi:hypothetical protein